MTVSSESSLQTPNFDLDELNRKYETAHPSKILAWCVENIPTGLVQTSAFNVDDIVITDILYRELKHRTPVMFLDTLHHFPQTLELVSKVKDLYDLDLQVYKTPDVDTRAAFAANRTRAHRA